MSADVRSVLESQYYAALAMLDAVIDRCPENLWTASSRLRPFWHVAYHALFYTHLYVQTDERDFRPWAKHRDEYQFLGPLPWPPHRLPVIGDHYAVEDVRDYLGICRAEVSARLPGCDLAATASGFAWLPFGKLELQLYNIRHIQQHTGELSQRLGDCGIEVPWIGLQPTSVV